MRFSLEFRAESLLFLAFMATVPVFSPNMVLFTKGFPYAEHFMPYFIYTLMALTAIGGIALGIYSGRHFCRRMLSGPVVCAAALSYLAGYCLFMLIGAVAGMGSIVLTMFAAALLAFGTVELGVAWGVYLATCYDLKQALIWIGIMVGVSSLFQLLLSAVTFQVGAVVFIVLLLAGVALPCYLARRGSLEAFEEALDFGIGSDGSSLFGGEGYDVVDEATGTAAPPADANVFGDMTRTILHASGHGASVGKGERVPACPRAANSLLRRYFANLHSMAKVLLVPFVGLLVFAYVMGVRKYMLFDLINVEILGGIGGAVLAVGICFVKRARPLLPYIYQVAMPIFALVIIALSPLTSNYVISWIHTCLIYVFFGAIGVFSLASLCAMAHAKEFSPVLIYGTTTSAFCLASALGLMCGIQPLFLNESGETMLNLIATGYFVFLLAYPLITSWKKIRSFDVAIPQGTDLEYLMSGGRELNTAQEALLRKMEGEEDQEKPDVATRCAKVAETYKLSPRETEIFGYLGRGHGIVFIAETLVISDSTVRTHVKNIYKKIGVSSREELLQLVDEAS